MTVKFFHYLVGVYPEALKSAVESSLLANQSTNVDTLSLDDGEIAVILVHRSKRKDRVPNAVMRRASLVILFTQGYPTCKLESEADCQFGKDATWLCGTELIRDFFPRLKDYIESNPDNLKELNPSGWIPKLDRFNALKILAQGYLVTHGCDKLQGYEGISTSNRIRLKSHAKETEDPQWWLTPLLAGTNKKATCSGVVDILVEQFKEELGEKSEKFNIVKQFLTCDINFLTCDIVSKLLGITPQATKT